MTEYHDRPGRRERITVPNPPPRRVISEEDLTAAITRIEGAATRIAAAAPADDSDEWRAQVEKAVKWASPWRQLIAFVVFLVVGAGSVYAAMRDYAKAQVVETVKEAHADDEHPLEPSVQTVNKLKKDVGSVKVGVDELVREKEIRKQIKILELELEPHQQQYQEQLNEWSSRKALRPNRNPGPKPLKTDRHIELEAQLKTLAGS